MESEHSARTRMEWRGQFKTPFKDECSNSLTKFEKSRSCCIPLAFRAGKQGFNFVCHFKGLEFLRLLMFAPAEA